MQPLSRIAAIRKELGLSQSTLAERLGVARTTVTRWETGEREADRATLMAIASTTGVSFEWLQTGEGPMFPPFPVPDPTKARSVLQLPVFSKPIFEADGETLCVPPLQAISKAAVESMVKQSAGRTDTLYLVRSPEKECCGIPPGNLVLVNSALELRRAPKGPKIHHVALPGQAPAFMRCFPSPPNLIVQADEHENPVLVTLAGRPIEEIVLGQVLTWFASKE